MDTGIDLRHEELAGAIVAHTSCVGSAGDPSKCTGSAPDAELVVAKVLGLGGMGSTEATALLGDPGALAEGLDYTWDHGAIPVVAAGNSNTLGLGLEGGGNDMLNAVVVASSGPDDSVATYSTPTGAARFAILAPGGAGNGKPADDIYSSFWDGESPNCYAYLAGTSMATPHVSGALALLLAQGHTPLGAVQRMLDTADGNVDCGPASDMCAGRLDVAAATAPTE